MMLLNMFLSAWVHCIPIIKWAVLIYSNCFRRNAINGRALLTSVQIAEQMEPIKNTVSFYHARLNGTPAYKEVIALCYMQTLGYFPNTKYCETLFHS